KSEFQKHAPHFNQYFDKNENQEQLEKTSEQIRNKAENSKVTELDLQGGYEWLGLKEANLAEKYRILSHAYLRKEADHFVVKKELDNNHKIKFGLGAGDILPPSATYVEITGRGQTKIGKRMIINGRVGYYEDDGTGKYMPIFGGYKIKILKSISEKSKAYAKAIEAEKQNYESVRDAAIEFRTSTINTPADVRAYMGRTDHPISTLSSLRQSDIDKLKLTEKGKEQVRSARIDLNRIDALSAEFGIAFDRKSQINGGLFLVGLGGKAAEMLGWNSDCSELEKQWTKQLKNPKEGEMELKFKDKLSEKVKVSRENGKLTIRSSSGQDITEKLESWINQKAASIATPSETVDLIKAMQNGTSYKGHKFKTQYFRFNLSHLVHLNALVKNPQKTKELFNKLGDPIRPAELIEALFIQGSMTLAEAKIFARENGMELLLQGNVRLDHLMQRGKHPVQQVTYNWNVHSNEIDHPQNGGEKCCARMVSDILGLRTVRQGRSASASRLIANVIRGNQEKHNTAGIIFGFENYQKGDVVAWQKYKTYLGHRTYAHVGIVRDRITINGQEFIAIQHDQNHIQIDLIPVKKGGSTGRIKRMLRNPATRHAFIAKQSPADAAKLESIYKYRYNNTSTVNVRSNTRWYGDGSKGGGGNIMFAVRTQGLQAGPRDKV
ncbi:hypothetical protein JKY72_02645, partial [Candidatus Gracilibacteria bacterium]|nr:hypothetical protein [Candidatus Gracilibacteria bacterium]